MQRTHVLWAAGLLAIPAAALAQPVAGPYVSLGAGASLFQDQSIRSISAPSLGYFTSGEGQVTSKIDFSGAAGVGWGFGNGFRAELSGNYLRNTTDNNSGLGGHGRTDAYGGFANVLYDFDLTAMGARAWHRISALAWGMRNAGFMASILPPLMARC